MKMKHLCDTISKNEPIKIFQADTDFQGSLYF